MALHFKIYTSVALLPNEWDTLANGDIFLKSSYLKALEQASPTNISWFYIGVFNTNVLVGIAIIQRVELYLKDIFRNYKDSCYQQKFKHFISTFLKGNMLVVGNLMHTGQHGFFFDNNQISQTDFLETVFDALDKLKSIIKKKSHKHIRIVMLKDYFDEDTIHREKSIFKAQKLHQITVQPNMVMEVKNSWLQFDDYVSDLNKKYKKRYKIAKKKAFNCVKKELFLDDIQAQSNPIHQLYKTVSDNAKINTFILPEQHFYTLKSNLKDRFKIFGYYFNDQLIGFYTLILNHKTLETYFLGYDETHQYANQLYLNMLYDMAQFGIENHFKLIVYARTAMEIKSSVGAKPKQMTVYLKHTNWLMNVVLNTIFGLMNPTQNWEERHPFK